ncbi:MAG: type II toxin-antitoxin system HicA family toxin [Candidatus Eremiobacterota bacterium]
MATVISRKEIIRKFRSLGYTGPFSGGRHNFMIKGQKKIRIPNPHGSGDIHISLVSEILRQADITRDEWDKA